MTVFKALLDAVACHSPPQGVKRPSPPSAVQVIQMLDFVEHAYAVVCGKGLIAL